MIVKKNGYWFCKNLLAHCKVCGIKFPNPYGLASAPPATTCAMIRWGHHHCYHHQQMSTSWEWNCPKHFAEDIFWIHGPFISTILADSLNCMEWWVKVSVRPCTNRDNIQFQLHQTMSVTRPEPMACIISLILVQFLVWLHPIQSVWNNRISPNNSKCNF